jgi:hypothetical protein
MERGTAHRGRVQAQGGGVEKSCPWAQKTPLTRDEGQQKVDTLEGGLTSKEKEGREEAFRQVRDYIDRVARAGGVDAPVSKTFPNRSRERSNIRLDIEVITGRAFVPDSK